MGRPKGIPSKFRLDLTGQPYNRLTGIKEIGVNKHGNTIWLFQCSCGNKHEAVAYEVKKGKIKSCGCWDKEATIARNQAGRKPDNFSVKYFSWILVKKRAKKFGREFDLNLEDYLGIVGQSCHYCGCEPYHCTRKSGVDFIHNGVDRVDNNQGYTLDNVVACCQRCNSKKGNRPYAQYI